MLENIKIDEIYKVILSLPEKTSEFKKAIIKKVNIKGTEKFQIEKFTKTQAFHENIDLESLELMLVELINTTFKDIQVFTKSYVYGFRKTSKGKILTNRTSNKESVFVEVSHNRTKKYLLEEGTPVLPLIDLGVMTSEGKVVKAHYDKYRQINKFLEILEDTIKNEHKKELHIIDFGCGKSYLTFIVYYYLTYIKKIKVKMTGLDLKEAVIDKCNAIRDKYRYENLEFKKGDISLYKPETYVDMIITLHACDVATDFAMYHAIKLNTKYLLSVPCCQHEINLQLKKNKVPILTKHGILKERFSALITDSIRANILEYFGYKTQIMEFVDFDSSPKNLLIRAIKIEGYQNEDALVEVKEIIEQLGVSQTLYKLLFKE